MKIMFAALNNVDKSHGFEFVFVVEVVALL
jgi:hypothetical protein